MAVENKVLACIFSPEKTGFEFFVPLVITIHFAVGKFLSPLGFEPKPLTNPFQVRPQGRLVITITIYILLDWSSFGYHPLSRQDEDQINGADSTMDM